MNAPARPPDGSTDSRVASGAGPSEEMAAREGGANAVSEAAGAVARNGAASVRPTVDDVRAAAGRLGDQVLCTPCLPSRTLGAIVGCEVFLKFENLQFTASFKERGALNKLVQLTPQERARGVLAVSAGNHAQAVAYHAERLGIAATIVMPRFAPSVKVERTRGFGAEVVLEGDTFDAARQHGLALASERGLVVVHPYDDAAVLAGQGTVGLEMLAQQPTLDTLVIPIGGGGLIGGIATAARALRPDIRIVGVQTERFPAAWCAKHGATRETALATIADGIGVKAPGELTLPLIHELVDDVVLVDEDDIEHAILLLLEIEKTVVEGAGAVGLAALTREPARFAGRRVGVVLSGGNIEPMVLAEIIERGMVKSGRLARRRCDVRDVPGALADVATLVGELGANIDRVQHQRVFTTLSVERVQVEMVVQTRGVQHIEQIVEALRAHGYAAERVI
jgi:threonine dehydratase